jgi:hypothetical protein
MSDFNFCYQQDQNVNEQNKKQKELELEGWQFASASSGEHLKRTLKMYEEIGIETNLVKVDAANCKFCSQCFEGGNEELYFIYIRKNEG